MPDRTLLALLRDDTLTLYTMNGTGTATEVANLRVTDRTPAGIATLVHGLAPFLAKETAPKPIAGGGILNTRPAPPGPPLQSGRPRTRKFANRLPASERGAELRAIVAMHPEGIKRADVLRAMGLMNPSGGQWKRIVEASGVRHQRYGAGHAAFTMYYPPEPEPPDGT